MLIKKENMSGCFGSSLEDRWIEDQLDEYLNIKTCSRCGLNDAGDDGLCDNCKCSECGEELMDGEGIVCNACKEAWGDELDT